MKNVKMSNDSDNDSLFVLERVAENENYELRGTEKMENQFSSMTQFTENRNKKTSKSRSYEISNSLGGRLR